MKAATTSFSRCQSRALVPQCRTVAARADYFGKDGMRQQLGGQGGADLNKLLGGSQPLDLGPASAPGGGAEDDPLNFDPEGTIAFWRRPAGSALLHLQLMVRF